MPPRSTGRTSWTPAAVAEGVFRRWRDERTIEVASPPDPFVTVIRMDDLFQILDVHSRPVRQPPRFDGAKAEAREEVTN